MRPESSPLSGRKDPGLDCPNLAKSTYDYKSIILFIKIFSIYQIENYLIKYNNSTNILDEYVMKGQTYE
jgi:hypothetical protein